MLYAEYSKTLKLEGSGVIMIPNGCRMKSGEFETYSLGHIARSADVTVRYACAMSIFCTFALLH